MAALCASLLLHIPLLSLLSLMDPADDPYEPSTTMASNSLQIDVVEEKSEEEEEKKEEERDEQLQFVTAPAPTIEERPDEARYLDRFDARTRKETVRKGLPGSARESATQKTAARADDAPDRQVEDDPAAREEVEQAREELETVEESDREGESSKEKTEDSPVVRKEPIPKSGGKINPESLFPNMENARFINPNGQAGSIDYLKDVDEGDKTLLNRKRSRYWAFFDRVKLQIRENWSPRTEYRKRDPYGDVYGVKDRYSAVRVTLNSDGTVRQLFVQRTSGLDFFDDEAVRSIRMAAPFHNPPEGLKDEDGLIHFTFGFYFEISSGPSLRIFN